jgi:hypothetical protein
MEKKLPELVKVEDKVPEIKIGQIFTVERKKYVIVQPMSDQQLADSNNHGHLVLTLIDI